MSYPFPFAGQSLVLALALFAAGCRPASVPATGDAPRVLSQSCLRGMTFAHEGYRGHNGYGGDLVGPSLDSLNRLGVNAVSIVPYTFMRGEGRVDSFPVPEHYGAENDSAVLGCIRKAHDRGLRIMLKPQIWVRGSWPGDIDFDSDADWDAFFDAYQRWILHYARMAERERVQSLCIGTELRYATLKHPERWRSMIAALRQEYHGTLTYAANWGEEFENLTFWDVLDVMGLNSYYPLSLENEPSDSSLRQGALTWMRMADEISRIHDRPYWLTEVGFRSVERAWQNPHAEAGERSASLEAQERCYAALAAAVCASERLEGMFIWKWPSYLGHQEDRAGRRTGFVPGGKPAGEVLRDLYRMPPVGGAIPAG